MNHAQRTCIWLVTLSISALAGAAVATNVTVGCPGGQPGQFTSITAALNSLDPFGPHTITVTGTCIESLFIGDRDGITIAAPNGQTATVNAASPGDIVIQFFRARRMALSGLVVQGGSTGVVVNFGSDAIISDCTIQNNSGDGLHPQQNATLVLQNSTVQKNGGNGITAASDSNVTLGTYPNQRIHINNNGFAGVFADGAYLQVNFGAVTIENNAGPGVLADGARLLFFGDSPQGSGTIIQNNQEGIGLFNGTRGTFWGQHIVRNNGPVGLQIDGSTVQAFGGALPDGTPDGFLIEEHTTLGLNITGSAEVVFSGSHRIRRNGRVGLDAEFLSGVRVSRASATINGGTQITNNFGPGILVDFNSNVQLGPDATISGNARGGINLLHMSVGDLTNPIHLSQSVKCDDTSLIFGDLFGKSIDCAHADTTLSSGLSNGLRR